MELLIINDKYLFVDRFKSSQTEMEKYNLKLINEAQAHWTKVGVTLIVKRTINWNETPPQIGGHLENLLKNDTFSLSDLTALFIIKHLFKQTEFMSRDYDGVVLMTGLMLPRGATNQVTLGVAMNNGTCTLINTMTLMAGNGNMEEVFENLGDVLAHELGHLIGLQHNGNDFCECNQTCVMVPAVNSALSHWTDCTLSHLLVLFDQKPCLGNQQIIVGVKPWALGVGNEAPHTDASDEDTTEQEPSMVTDRQPDSASVALWTLTIINTLPFSMLLLTC